MKGLMHIALQVSQMSRRILTYLNKNSKITLPPQHHFIGIIVTSRGKFRIICFQKLFYSSNSTFISNTFFKLVKRGPRFMNDGL